jgi:hypothetical protein
MGEWEMSVIKDGGWMGSPAVRVTGHKKLEKHERKRFAVRGGQW